jgi:hypothetical protein
MMRTAVTVMAIALRVTTMKDKEATDVLCVHVPIALTAAITDKMATNLVKVVISLVLATIVRAVTSLAMVINKEKAAISHVPVIIAKAGTSHAKATSKEKVAISHAPVIIVKVVTSLAKEAISKEKAATTVVPVLPATILMQSTA